MVGITNKFQVYRCYDKEGVLIYIGGSICFPTRIDGLKRKPWFDSIATITIEHHTSKMNMRDAERLAIRLENPLLKITSKS